MHFSELESKSIAELKQISKSLEYPEIICFPRNVIESIEIPLDAKDHLLEVGLPKWTAPHLNFGPFQNDDGSYQWCPKLGSWAWLPDLKKSPPTWLNNKTVIGSQTSPIILETDGQVFLLDAEEGFRSVLVNSSVQHLFRTLIYFTCFVEGYQNLFEDKNASKEDVHWFKKQIIKFDALASADGTFWSIVLNDLMGL